MELNPVFARRLYLAALVEEMERPNVPRLIEATGWPRRTIQDVLKSLSGLGIDMTFIQDGKRHNDGYYQLKDWGRSAAIGWKIKNETFALISTSCSLKA
nr:helix-turn-helix domain-containing protein [Salinivibrio socompensis]